MGRLGATIIVVVGLSFVLSCQEEPDGDGDSDSDSDSDGDGDGDIDIEVDPPEPPEPPAEPELPVLTPCPSGWREVPPEEPDGVTICDPWPEGGPQDCAEDEAHFPGEPGCTRIGSACPVGDWAEDLPADASILYVRADEPPGGDGSQAAPFGTIADAMVEASEGTIIALSKGTFDEEIRLRRGVTLWGACVAETLVTCSEANDMAGTILVRGADTEVRNLSVSGQRPGVWVDGAATGVHVEDVRITESARIAWLVLSGARSTGRSVVINQTQPDAEGHHGRGLGVEDGGEVELQRAVISGNREDGVYVGGEGATLTVSDTFVRDTVNNGPRESGWGLNAVQGAHVDILRSVFSGNVDSGVIADGAATELTIADSIVQDTRTNATDISGIGLDVRDGARAEVNRVHFVRNRFQAMSAGGSGTELTMTDVVAEETLAHLQFGVGLNVLQSAVVTADRALFERNWAIGVAAFNPDTHLRMSNLIIRDTLEYGVGLYIGDEAQVDASQAVFENNRTFSVSVEEEGTVLNLTDVVIRDTQCGDTGYNGTGLDVSLGAEVNVLRALFDQNRDAAIWAMEPNTTVNLTDVMIQGTHGDCNGELGLGLMVNTGAQMTVHRAALDRNRDTAIWAFEEGTVLTVTDIVVRDTSCDDNGEHGRGMEASYGAVIDGRRLLFERNHDYTIMAGSSDTTMTLTDVMIRDSLEKDCASENCSGRGAGHGIVSRDNAHIALTTFEITGSALCGVQVALDGTMDLRDGVIADNLIGANVQTADFDWNRLLNNVTFSDNELDFDSNQLPVPEVSLPPDWLRE